MATQTLLAYGATWKYKEGAAGHSSGFQASGYDDSAWSSGPAIFGTQGSCLHTPATPWSILTDLCVRVHVTVPPGTTSITLTYGIDNNAVVYWNGTQIQSVTHVGCATNTDQTVTITTGFTAGDNVIAVRGSDIGDATFFDMRVTAVVPDPTPGVWIDWDRDGFDDSTSVGSGLARMMPTSSTNLSDNVTADVIGALEWQRGASADHVGAANPGTFSFRLFDPTNPVKYNPDNTASPFYGKLAPGLPVWGGCNADGTLEGTGQTVSGLFAGYTREFVPVVVDGATVGCDVLCDDPLSWYADQAVSVAPSLTRSVKQLREAILDAIGESSARRSLEDEIDTLPISAVDSENALGVLEELNRATGTRHFVKPADSKEDWYFYTTVNKLHKLTSSADASLDGDDVDEIDGYRVTRDNIVNRQRASVEPIGLSPATETVWTYSEVPITVTFRKSLVFWAEFSDYVYNAAVQYNLSSGSIIATITNFGKTAKVVVTSQGVTRAVISSLIVTGQVVRRGDPLKVIADDLPSQNRYGVRAGSEISSDFIGQPDIAQGLVDYLVWKFAQPQYRPSITVTAKNAATRSFVFDRDCFDVVNLGVDRLSVTSRRFEIVGVSGRLEPGRLYRVGYQLQGVPGPFTNWFTLDSSSLDGSDILAPF